MLHYMPAQCTSYLTTVKQLKINIAVASLFLWRKAIKKPHHIHAPVPCDCLQQGLTKKKHLPEVPRMLCSNPDPN